MRKTNSVKHMTAIHFDLKECQIGQSQIEKLPIKNTSKSYLSRRHSTNNVKSIEVNCIPKKVMNNQDSEVEKLRKINDIYRKQNQLLKKKIDVYQQRQMNEYKERTKATSRIANKPQDYKEIIKNRFSNTKFFSNRNSRVVTECETALISRQISSCDQDMNLNEFFQNFKKGNTQPSVSQIHELVNKFIKDYTNNFYILEHIFNFYKIQKKESSFQEKEIIQLLEVFKIPIKHQKSPKTLLKSLNKDVNMKKTSQKKEMVAEMMSPNETIQKVEKLLSKIVKSHQLLKIIRIRQPFKKMLRQIREQLKC